MFKNCPYCKKHITYVNIEDMPVHVSGQYKWNGIAYVCPNIWCNSILSVAIDPIAIKADIVNEIKK